MFGSLGVPELLLIFVVILIVFGPRRIPEIGRTLGKALGEFRKATDDLKSTIEREVRLEELKKIAPPTLDSFMTPSEAVSRTEPYAEETFPPAPTTVPEPDATAVDVAPADVTPQDAAPAAVEVEPGK
ncbi:MAG TPA: twin-arginine translocase TatA/TatE family subunit [Thermoanaerobaculia bacterium]|nr:twin-arginine translocase TatA/TatE family subunit [Thermoanaerobaculia bacterium]